MVRYTHEVPKNLEGLQLDKSAERAGVARAPAFLHFDYFPYPVFCMLPNSKSCLRKEISP